MPTNRQPAGVAWGRASRHPRGVFTPDGKRQTAYLRGKPGRGSRRERAEKSPYLRVPTHFHHLGGHVGGLAAEGVRAPRDRLGVPRLD